MRKPCCFVEIRMQGGGIKTKSDARRKSPHGVNAGNLRCNALESDFVCKRSLNYEPNSPEEKFSPSKSESASEVGSSSIILRRYAFSRRVASRSKTRYLIDKRR